MLGESGHRVRNPALNKSFSAVGSLADGPSKPPRPALHAVASRSMRSVGMSSTTPATSAARNREDGGGLEAGDSDGEWPHLHPQPQQPQARAQSATAIRRSPVMGRERALAYLPSSASPTARAGYGFDSSGFVPVGDLETVGDTPVSQRRPYSSSLSSPMGGRAREGGPSLGASPSSLLGPGGGKKAGHVSVVHRLAQARGEGAGGAAHRDASVSTVARFLTADEMYAADLDKRELVQEWLASLAKEDLQFSSAMLEAEVKLRCGRAGVGSGWFFLRWLRLAPIVCVCVRGCAVVCVRACVRMCVLRV